MTYRHRLILRFATRRWSLVPRSRRWRQLKTVQFALTYGASARRARQLWKETV